MSKWAHQQEMSHWCAGASCTAHLVPMVEYSGTSRAGCSTIGSLKSSIVRVLHHENQGTPKSQFTSTRCLGQYLWFYLGLSYFEKLFPQPPVLCLGTHPAMTLWPWHWACCRTTWQRRKHPSPPTAVLCQLPLVLEWHPVGPLGALPRQHVRLFTLSPVM